MQRFKGLSLEDFRPFDPLSLEILPKNVFLAASQAVFWSPSCYRELKLTTKLFTGCTLCGLILIQMQYISLRSSVTHRNQNFEIVFGYKSDTEVFTFTFCFLSSPLFSLFLTYFFSFAKHLVGFILMGKVFKKAFRILELDERKGRWVVEQDFHGNFQVNVTLCFCLFLWFP